MPIFFLVGMAVAVGIGFMAVSLANSSRQSSSNVTATSGNTEAQPGSGGGGGSGAGGAVGGGGGGGPAHCGYSYDQTYSQGGATIHEQRPTSGCYIHVTEAETYSDIPSPGPPCSSSLGAPPSTVSNIIDWEYAYQQDYGTTYEVYTLELDDHLTITITGCHFNSYGSTELNHLTSYDYVGGG